MKNLKDEIEGILVEGFATAPSRCWACEARTPKEEIAGKREQNLEHIGTITDSITSLIEQESERAVKDWMDYLFKEHGEWVELDEARYRNAWEQYLAERKG